MFENRVLRRIFGPKGDEVTREWRKLHNEELNDLYCSSNVTGGDQIENNEMGAAHSTYGREKGWVNLRKRNHLEDPGVDGRIILRWIFRKWNVRAWTEDRDRWRELVNAVMNHQFPRNVRNSLSSSGTVYPYRRSAPRG